MKHISAFTSGSLGLVLSVRTLCGADEYYNAGSTVKCVPVIACQPGEYESVRPTMISNRVCAKCNGIHDARCGVQSPNGLPALLHWWSFDAPDKSQRLDDTLSGEPSFPPNTLLSDRCQEGSSCTSLLTASYVNASGNSNDDTAGSFVPGSVFALNLIATQGFVNTSAWLGRGPKSVTFYVNTRSFAPRFVPP